MDFKSVVYNAARDGKLKRLKVSTLTRVMVSRDTADVSAITHDRSKPVRTSRCGSTRRHEPPFVRDEISDERSSLLSEKSDRFRAGRGNESSAGDSMSGDVRYQLSGVTIDVGNGVFDVSPGVSRRGRRLRDDARCFRDSDAPNGVSIPTFRGTGCLRRHRAIPQPR